MSTWKSLLLGIVLGLFLSGAIILVAQPPRGEALVLGVPPTPPTTIVVYITGAVKNPGVYTLSHPGRVTDAVDAAGGMLDSTDRSAINLAAKIDDGSKIVVPYIPEAATLDLTASAQKKPTPTLHVTPTVSFPININCADATLLDYLPGIGATKAAAIVTYRQEHGPFKKIEDIMNVPGIGTGLFNSIKGIIAVNDAP